MTGSGEVGAGAGEARGAGETHREELTWELFGTA
jgi:hypothetical protein